ncbi:hypothetical protein Mgra_00004355 [Meloidogyne graminicola]|uniref:Uncharacterized protein n=1 Tax=Meloidogyne graminicola TaxID=189291 RepID=A0A8S9ZRX1_9BILA|nr:hypothetical protein Mgra_00004355 [Meloidogyne graminicola]
MNKNNENYKQQKEHLLNLKNIRPNATIKNLWDQLQQHYKHKTVCYATCARWLRAERVGALELRIEAVEEFIKGRFNYNIVDALTHALHQRQIVENHENIAP